jgi:hypothetical protein
VSMSSASSCSLPGLRPDRMLLLGQPMRLKYLHKQVAKERQLYPCCDIARRPAIMSSMLWLGQPTSSKYLHAQVKTDVPTQHVSCCNKP